MLKEHSIDFIHEDQVTRHKDSYSTWENSCLTVCGSNDAVDVMVMSSGLSQLELQIVKSKPASSNCGSEFERGGHLARRKGVDAIALWEMLDLSFLELDSY